MSLQSPLDARRKRLRVVFAFAALLTAVAWWQKGDLAPVSELRPELLQEPLQTDIEGENFEFTYKGKRIDVDPVAEYEMWGLVVSHNNIKSVSDIYHDSSSVDTKDLCVVWGDSLRNGSYLDVEFWSGPWTCYFRYDRGVPFEGMHLGNNHMITGSDALRDQLGDVRIGDQIRVRGQLVNYHVEDWRNWWRRSSTNRFDSGNGACEVIYFTELEVLEAGTPGWYLAYRVGLGLLLLVPLLFLHTLWLDAKRSERRHAPDPAVPAELPDVWQGDLGTEGS